MTTAADIVRVAEEVRAAGLIYRDQRTGYVSIQQSPPYSGDNDRFGTMWVEHCGISVAYVLTRAGLRFGVDYPDGIQYSPSLAVQLLRGGYDQTPQPGAVGVIDWGAAGYGATAYSDHVVLIIRVDGDYYVTWETNTTADGGAYYYRRHKSLFTAVGMPKGLTDDPTPPTPAASAIPALTAVLASL
jgi:hypothetical protein